MTTKRNPKREAFEQYLAQLAERKVATLKVTQPDAKVRRGYRDVRVIGLGGKEQG